MPCSDILEVAMQSTFEVNISCIPFPRLNKSYHVTWSVLRNYHYVLLPNMADNGKWLRMDKRI